MGPIGAYSGNVIYIGSFCFRDALGFQNCDDIVMRVVKAV